MSQEAIRPTAGDDVVERAWRALASVVDPELGIDMVALGLVYGVRYDAARGSLEADVTLTTPGCPVSEQLPDEAAEALRRALPGVPVEVRVVWDPPWSPERMAPEALARLGLGGRSG